MKKVPFCLIAYLFFFIIFGNQTAHSFSLIKPKNIELNYLKRSEFKKLSYKNFNKSTSQKPNLWNKLSFKIIILKIKTDLKIKSDRLINKKFISITRFQRVLFWILIGLFALLGLFFIIFGFAPR
jgi:hypothetical protein